MFEPVSGAGRFGGEIAAVIGIDRRLKRHAAGDLDSRMRKLVKLGRIVGDVSGVSCRATGAEAEIGRAHV